RVAARLDQPDRALVAARGHADRAADRDLLHDDLVGNEVRDRPEALHAGEHDGAAGPHVLEPLAPRPARARAPLHPAPPPPPPRRRRPRRPVSPRTRRFASSFSTSSVAFAPTSRASASLRASAARPVTTICDAPASRHASTEARPRCPGPRISTVSPGPVSGISTAQRKPAPSGLKSTARLGSSDGSILWTIEFGWRYMSSA